MSDVRVVHRRRHVGSLAWPRRCYAMSGVREFTLGVGLLRKPPPDQIARILGVTRGRDQPIGQHLAVAADHVLYGFIVTDRSPARR